MKKIDIIIWILIFILLGSMIVFAKDYQVSLVKETDEYYVYKEINKSDDDTEKKVYFIEPKPGIGVDFRKPANDVLTDKKLTK